MSIGKAIGAIEFSSVGLGYSAQDEMLKAASVELLIAITPCTGCLPGLNHAISVGGNRSSRATGSTGKFVCSILNSSGQALDEMNKEPFIGCPGSPRLITRPD